MKSACKALAAVLSISLLDLLPAGAQTYMVQGVISIATAPVQYASVTFTDVNDATNRFTATTDISGNYRTGVVITSVTPDNNLPANFELAQNYPNPFSASTAISYNLNKQADVYVTIYDLLGRKVKSFSVGSQAAGAHGVVWDGRNGIGKTVASGVYFYRLNASGETQVKKMVFGLGNTNAPAGIPKILFVQRPEREERVEGSTLGKSFTVWVRNTDSTYPAITPEQVGTVTISRDQTLNFGVSGRSQAVAYPDSTRQVIRGFGGTNMAGWDSIEDLTADEVHTAFGTGEGQVGMTILRIRVPYDSTQFHLEVPTAALAKSLGATIMASPWSPPPSMKSNDSIVGGILKPGSYADFANFLKSFADFMSENGAALDAISVQNEPDVHVGYESCDYDATQMLSFVKNNAPAIGTKIIAPESYKFNQAMSDTLLNDSVACANLSIVGCHLYSAGALQPYPLARSKGKEIWMTEHIVGCYGWPDAFPVAQEINDCMKADMSAYLLWYIRRSYGPIFEDGSVNKGGYAMAQYSRFVRPGYHRIGATVEPSQTGVDMTAYKNGSKVVIVVLNGDRTIEQTFTIHNGTLTSATPYVTSGSRNCERGTAIPVSNGSFTATLYPMSVTTFVVE